MIDNRKRLLAIQKAMDSLADYNAYRVKCNSYKIEIRSLFHLRKEQLLFQAQQTHSSVEVYYHATEQHSTISSLINPNLLIESIPWKSERIVVSNFYRSSSSQLRLLLYYLGTRIHCIRKSKCLLSLTNFS